MRGHSGFDACGAGELALLEQLARPAAEPSLAPSIT
jgi:hypothetical protein